MLQDENMICSGFDPGLVHEIKYRLDKKCLKLYFRNILKSFFQNRIRRQLDKTQTSFNTGKILIFNLEKYNFKCPYNCSQISNSHLNFCPWETMRKSTKKNLYVEMQSIITNFKVEKEWYILYFCSNKDLNNTFWLRHDTL